jgi:hypothetical protein
LIPVLFRIPPRPFAPVGSHGADDVHLLLRYGEAQQAQRRSKQGAAQSADSLLVNN